MYLNVLIKLKGGGVATPLSLYNAATQRKKVLIELFGQFAVSKGGALVARRNGRNSPNGVSLLIYASARPVDDEAEVEIGKNKEYRERATRTRPRRLCF